MACTLLAVGLLSLAPLAGAAATAPGLPFTEVLARDGKLVVLGKEFQATAHRVLVTPDGKRVHLVGTDDEPARLLCRPAGPHTRLDVSGKRIVYSPADGSVRVEGTGKLVEKK